MATIIILVISIRQTLWLPVYPDEISSKITLERYFLSGGFKQALMPACSNGFLMAPPLSLLPAAVSWALLDHLGNGLLSFRLLPILCLLLVLFSALYRQTSYKAWPTVLILTYGPILYGILIFRAEVFTLTAAFFLYSTAIRFIGKVSSVYCFFLTALALFFLDLAVYVHPKDLYIVPLAIVCVIFGTLRLIGGFTKTLYFVVFSSCLAWVTRDALKLNMKLLASCDNAPFIAKLFKGQAVNVLDILYDRPHFVESLSQAFSSSQIAKAIGQITYKSSYNLAFLPSTPVTGWIYATNVLIIVSLGAAFLYAIAKIAIGCLLPPDRQTQLSFIVLGLFFSTFLFIGISNLTKAFYDCSMLACAICLSAMLASPYRLRRGFEGFARTRAVLSSFAGGLLILTGLLSVAINRQHFTSEFKNGYLGPSADLLSAKQWLVPRLSAATMRYAIKIDEPLVIDDLTYDEFKHHPVAVPVTYLLFSGGTLIPHALADYHIRHGVFYCSYVDDLKAFVAITVLEKIPLPFNVPPVCIVSF